MILTSGSPASCKVSDSMGAAAISLVCSLSLCNRQSRIIRAKRMRMIQSIYLKLTLFYNVVHCLDSLLLLLLTPNQLPLLSQPHSDTYRYLDIYNYLCSIYTHSSSTQQRKIFLLNY